MPKSKVVIGLYWHSFKSSNLGVSALTDANMTLIKDAANGTPVEFILFSPDGSGDFEPPKEFANVRYVKVSKIKHALSIVRSIRSCDLVYDIGAGDSFSDIYGWKRLGKIAGLKIVSALCQRRPVLSPQTIGPFSSSAAKLVGKVAIRCCRSVFARDIPSFDRARALLGKNSDTHLGHASDLAFGLKQLSPWPEDFPEVGQGNKHVGINVSGLLYNGGYSGINQFGLSLDYKRLILEIIEDLSAREDIQVWLIPHVFHVTHVTRECDRAVSVELHRGFPNVKFAPIFRNAREAKTFIGRMDLVLAARMHAAIAAVSSGVACLPMSYSVKFQGLFESINYPYTIDLKGNSLDEAKAQVLAALDKTDSIAVKAILARDIALKALAPYRSHVSEDITRVMRA